MASSRIRRPLSAVAVLALTSILVLGTVSGLSGHGDDAVSVTTTMPQSRNVDPDAPVGVVFSRDVAPDSSTGVTLTSPPARVSPDVPGVWIWKTPRWLSFMPDDAFTPGSRVTLRIDPGRLARSGAELYGDDRFDFEVGAFRCTDSRITARQTGGRRRELVLTGRWSFNAPVDETAFRAALKLSYDGRTVRDFDVTTSRDGRELAVESAPVTASRQRARARAELSGRLRSRDGGLIAGGPVIDEIRSLGYETLEIGETSFESRGLERWVEIRVSHHVDAAELRRRLTVEPEVADLSVRTSWRSVKLYGEWETGRTYDLTIDGDLTTDEGHALVHDFTRRLTVDDYGPSVDIAAPGHYLPVRGDLRVGVTTVNVKELDLTVHRVYANNLVTFLHDHDLERDRRRFSPVAFAGEEVKRTIPVRSPLRNAACVTPVDLSDVVDADSRGVFRLRVVDKDDAGNGASRWIITSDLGLVAKYAGDELFAAVVSFDETRPLADVAVRVVSYNNQVLAEARTDRDGAVVFRGLPAEGGGSRPYLLTAERGDDLGFLCLDETRITAHDLDVGGLRGRNDALRAFVWGDRDLYRPGESANLAWLVRDHGLHAPDDDFPLTLVVAAPGGKIHRRAKVRFDEAGAGSVEIEFPSWVRTGVYDVLLKLDERTVIGRTKLRVEDFMPDRMKVSAAWSGAAEGASVFGPGDRPRVDLEALTIYGPPAADRECNGLLRYATATVAFAAWPHHVFGDPESELDFDIEGLGEQKTDAHGSASWSPELKKLLGYHGWVTVTADITVRELDGGRALHAAAEHPYSPVSRLIGLRNLSAEESDYVEAGVPLRFSAVLAGLDGVALTSEGVELRVLRRRWNTVLRRVNGRLRYVSEPDETVVQTRTIDLAADATGFEVVVPDNGSYRLVLETADGAARASTPFYVYGWNAYPWSLEQPELVNLKLDRESYAPGDELTVSIEAPFSGLALLTIEREAVMHRRWVRLEENTAAVTLRVPDDAAPNAYVTAVLLRPHAELEPFAPARAFGAVPVFVDRELSRLAVELEAPERMRPHNRLPVRVRLPDAGPGGRARVTIAAVDEGILQQTDFTTPSPLDFFLARRGLAVGSYDIWSLLLPGYERVERSSSTGGGDGYAAAMSSDAKRLNPLAVDRVKPVALWSGVLEGSDEWRTVELDVPEYNGTLRVMAVAAEDDRFGSAEAAVIVRDPFVMQPNLPRALAPGDEFLVTVPVFNGDPGGEGPVDVTLELEGPVELIGAGGATRGLDVPFEKERAVNFRVRALDAVGKAVFRFRASRGAAAAVVETDVPVRPPRPLSASGEGGLLDAGAEASVVIGDDAYPGTGWTTIQVSSLPLARFGAALPYVLRYPHGCAEQVTSKTFPLLYFGDLAAQVDERGFAGRDADYFVHAGLDHLLALHRPGRGFAMWSSWQTSWEHPWASTYVTHFLLEAKRKGFAVPQDVLDDALGYLSRTARGPDANRFRSWSRRSVLRTRAYACFVLALAGRPELGVMDDLATAHVDDLPTGGLAYLGGAFALAGDTGRFERIFPAGVDPNPGDDDGWSWWTAAQDDGIALQVLATVAPEDERIAALLSRLAGRSRDGRWANTQENGVALTALGLLADHRDLSPASGDVLVDGEVVASFDGDDLVHVGRDWAGATVTIRNREGGAAYWSVLDEGVPRTDDGAETDAGLRVTREYYDESGRDLDLDEALRGQMVICRLRLDSDRGEVKDVVVTDLLPAGFEIETKQLDARRAPEGLSSALASNRLLRVEHVEARDDRLLLFTRAPSSPRDFFYTLRAVTPGSFTLPPVRAEAMYDASVFSVSSSGRLVVEPR